MEHALRGVVGVQAPWWTVLVTLWYEVGMPPWQLEAECSQVWWERLMCYRDAMARTRDG